MSTFKIWVFRSTMILGLGFSMSMVFHPDVKSAIRESVLTDQRLVLSTANGKFGQEDKNLFHIVKVKTRDSVIVEIYRSEGMGSLPLVDRITLPSHKDAFFNFQGRATNLVLDDLNGDSVPELLVPSLDKELVAQLNIFQFHPESQKFAASTLDSLQSPVSEEK